MVNLYVDVVDKVAITSPSSGNPPPRPDIRAPGIYVFSIYFMRFNPDTGLFAYQRYQYAQLVMNLRQDAPPDYARFSLSFNGYQSQPIDASLSNNDIKSLLEAIPSIGVGNVLVTGSVNAGWTIEFIGAMAGLDQPMLVGSIISATPNADIKITSAQIASRGVSVIGASTIPYAAPTSPVNAQQLVKLRLAPLATASAWLETGFVAYNGTDGVSTSGSPTYTSATAAFVAGDVGKAISGTNIPASTTISAVVNATTITLSANATASGTALAFTIANRTIPTPGWQCNLDTSSVPISTWNNPLSNIYLELLITPQGARTGTDGVTADDGRTRSGTGATNYASTGVTGASANAVQTGNSWLVAHDAGGTYGRLFVPADVGRTVTVSGGGMSVPAGTTIVAITTGATNSALLSNAFVGYVSGGAVTYNTSDLPSDTFYFPGANLAPIDLGHIVTGDAIPSGSQIINIIDSQRARLSNVAASTATNNWAIQSKMSNVFAAVSGAFASSDVGKPLVIAGVLAPNTVITSVIDGGHVVLSQLPLSAATGLSWTLMAMSGFPLPTVTEITQGSLGAYETQRVALSSPPYGGKISFQDGAMGTMPIVSIRAPIDVHGLSTSLGASYQNFGTMSIVERLPGAEYDLTWGVYGQQRLLIVSDALALYDPTVLKFVLADAVTIPNVSGPSASGFSLAPASWPPAPVPQPPTYVIGNTRYVGIANDNYYAPLHYWPQLTKVNDATNATMFRQRYRQFAHKYAPTGIYGGFWYQGVFYYNLPDQNQEYHNHFVEFDRVAVSMPANRVEKGQQTRSVVGVATSNSIGFGLDTQLFSVSVSTWCYIYYYYAYGNSNIQAIGDSPIGTIIHFMGIAQPYLFRRNGFDPVYGTWGRQFWQSYSVRRWMGNIWEVAAVWN